MSMQMRSGRLGNGGLGGFPRNESKFSSKFTFSKDLGGQVVLRPLPYVGDVSVAPIRLHR